MLEDEVFRTWRVVARFASHVRRRGVATTVLRRRSQGSYGRSIASMRAACSGRLL
jgi:hypothetical protein